MGWPKTSVRVGAVWAAAWAPRVMARDPRAMPGHTRGPRSNTAARAMPEGGQTTVAKPGDMARANPNQPVTA